MHSKSARVLSKVYFDNNLHSTSAAHCLSDKKAINKIQNVFDLTLHLCMVFSASGSWVTRQAYHQHTEQGLSMSAVAIHGLQSVLPVNHIISQPRQHLSQDQTIELQPRKYKTSIPAFFRLRNISATKRHHKRIRKESVQIVACETGMWCNRTRSRRPGQGTTRHIPAHGHTRRHLPMSQNPRMTLQTPRYDVGR
jgi:hypothetical protein